MSQRPNYDQVFVLGHSHCGSTLLGRMLNMHQDIFCPGELFWFDDAIEKSIPCSCGSSTETCSFWAGRLQHIPLSARSDYRKTCVASFNSIKDSVGKKVFLDLSKSRVYRHRKCWKWPSTGFVFLVRDPRGILASRMRDGGEFGHELRRHRKWQKRFEWLTARMAPNSITIFYEDFVREPDATLKALYAFMGVAPLDGVPSPANAEHHFIHSSTSPYMKGARVISADERWRSELSPEQISKIERKLSGSMVYAERYGLGKSPSA